MPPDADALIGRTLGRYRIDGRLGAGGMGVVLRATDLRLQRTVALKVLHPAGPLDEERRRRFLREARAASRLNHPGIITIHEVDSTGGVDYIVMELVPGEPLAERLARGPLPIAEAIGVAAQLAAAVEAAHAAGIVHRDLKPANLVLRPDNRLKVLDFGIARPVVPAAGLDTSALSAPATVQTRTGQLLGTPEYMSPEQVLGEPAGPAADIWSAGVLLYEMIAGRRPFTGATVISMLASVVERDPPRLDEIRPETPRRLVELIASCLDKDPHRRPVARELRERLEALAPTGAIAQAPASAARRRRLVVILMAGLLGAGLAATGGVVWWQRHARRQWARAEAPLEIRRLAGEGRLVAALRLAEQALAAAPEDPQLRQEWQNLGIEARIESEPAGADVEYSDYQGALPWRRLGRTPVEHVRLPRNARWRLTLPGYETLEATGEVVSEDGRPRLLFRLARAGVAPPGMVRVAEGRVDAAGAPVRVPEYWIDRYEVTNREFRRFVEAGGYRDARFWPAALASERGVRFDEAVRVFVDATGRPGPATWELGAPPEGDEDLPVGGVSWFEAAAYARFAGKQLPTLHHWARAAGLTGIFADVLTASNFEGKGKAAGGSHRGVGPFGTYDMAGNVKEWTGTAVGAHRYILGGAWNEPPYTYRDLDALPPFERQPQHGFRCIKSIASLPDALLAPVERTSRDFTREKPASDEVFAAYARLYAYDRLPLEARTDAVDDSNPHWRRETVSFAAAYGGERVPAHVFVPRRARAPYQAVVFHCGADGLLLASSRDLWLQWVEFVVRSGRLVVYPVLKGMYERRVSAGGANAQRDTIVQRSKDVGRTVDYLASRGDVDTSRIAYYGLSLGAQSGLTAVAMESRFRAVVLAGGGIFGGPDPPEVDELHFAPRVRAPTLMLNGRHDFDVPLETAQRPLFRLLGSPAAGKRHVLIEGGHIPSRMNEVIREILGWLDAQLGSVG